MAPRYGMAGCGSKQDRGSPGSGAGLRVRFGDAGEGGDVEHFAAGGGVDAGGPEAALGFGGAAGPAGQRGPEGLAPLGEGRVDDGEDLLPGWPWWPAVPGG